MAKILVYNNDRDRMETYYREENQAMPYVTGNTLTVGEFRGSSRSPTLWTEKRAMQSWNATRYLFGSPIPVGYAFKRPYEGGHSSMSQHYAGVCFYKAQTLSITERNRLRNVANESGVWSYVEPANLTPTWVHFDKRRGVPACGAGYPVVRQGTRGAYVLILQDSLNTLGYRTGGLDGVFGPRTREAVTNYQRKLGLTVDGIVGCNTWRSILEGVVGKGRTATTID